MKPSSFIILVPTLTNLYPGALEWNDGLEFIYERKLRDIPDEIVGVLHDAIIDTYDKRPTPKQVYELALSLMGNDRRSLGLQVVTEITRLRDKYGLYAAPMPGFEDRFPNIAERGVPAELSEAGRKVIAFLGGWDAWCTVEVMDINQRRVVEKAAQAILDAEPTEVMAELKATFQQNRLQARQVAMLESGDNEPAKNDVITSEQATQTMHKLGAVVKSLPSKV